MCVLFFFKDDVGNFDGHFVVYSFEIDSTMANDNSTDVKYIWYYLS